MKFKSILLLGFIFMGCNDKGAGPQPTSQNLPIKEPPILDAREEHVKMVKFTLSTELQNLVVTQVHHVPPRESLPITHWIRIESSSSNLDQNRIYKFKNNGQLITDSAKTPAMVSTFTELEARSTESLELEGDSISFNSIKETLRLESFYNLYRCRNTELGATLADQDLMFAGDWHIAVGGISQFLQIPLQLVLVFSRSTAKFMNIAFVKAAPPSKSYAQQTVASFSLYRNIPAEIYIGNTQPPSSGRYEHYRQDCDDFYDKYFKTNNDPDKEGVRTFKDAQKIYLPIFNKDFEESLYTPEQPLLQWPISIINPVAIKEYGMLKSPDLEMQLINDFFLNPKRFPLDIHNYENDPLWTEVINKGAMQ